MQGMYRWRPWRLGVVLAATVTSASALVLAAGPASAGPASAGPANAQPVTGSASSNVSAPATVTADAWAAGRAAYGKDATASQAVTAYWTPERMHAAKKIEDSAAYLDAVNRYDRAVQVKRDQVRLSPNRTPDAPAQPHSVAPKPGSVDKPATADKPAGMTPAAYDPGFAYWQPTARTSGKVFFTMGGSGFQCSATIVNSEGQNTVWTAGHCVNQGGGSGVWASNWQFVPAYDDDMWWNPRPYGTWTATQLWSRTAWINSSDFAEDMGVAIMGMNFGYHIVGYLGGQGITTGVGNRVWENAFGYPAESPFDGGNLYQCWGTSSPEWEVLWWWSETIQIPCDMTRGSSGGGWLYNWDGNWGYLNGVNSRIDRIVSPTIMLSPYFDDTAWSLYNATRYL